MPQPQGRSAPRYAHRDAEEDRAWSRLYRRAGDPTVAAEVVRQLDLDAESKRWHLALYLRCRHTLRRRKATQLRRQRIGRLVRAVFVLIVSKPAAAVRDWLGSGDRRVPIAPLPPPAPSVHDLRRLPIAAWPRPAASSPDLGSVDEKAA